MTYRRSLTPSPSPQAGGDAAFKQRRADARREVSERVLLRREGETTELIGWALNISRGGVRAILEQKVALGEEFDVTVGEAKEAPLQRKGRIVWVQEEPDGLIVGIEFLNLSIHPPPAPTE